MHSLDIPQIPQIPPTLAQVWLLLYLLLELAWLGEWEKEGLIQVVHIDYFLSGPNKKTQFDLSHFASPPSLLTLNLGTQLNATQHSTTLQYAKLRYAVLIKINIQFKGYVV